MVNGLFNFALIRIWAFPPERSGLSSDLTRFCIVAAVSFVVNYASFAVLYSAIGIGAEPHSVFAILIAAPVTFLLNRLWSFRSHPRRTEASSGSTVARSCPSPLGTIILTDVVVWIVWMGGEHQQCRIGVVPELTPRMRGGYVYTERWIIEQYLARFPPSSTATVHPPGHAEQELMAYAMSMLSTYLPAGTS